jgi:DNA-binding response OmpR family regulator
MDAAEGLEVVHDDRKAAVHRENTREAKDVVAHDFSDDRDCLDNSKPALLIIEDDPNFAKVLYKACHQQGCHALVAAGGGAGLELARRYPIKGVVLDYMLPGLDGGEVLSALKADDATKNLPVHIVTALDELSDIQVRGSIGQTVKPTTAKEIKNVIEQLLESAGSRLCLLVVEDDDATFLA